MNLNLLQNKYTASLWLISIKILDHFSTLKAVKHNWQNEVNLVITASKNIIPPEITSALLIIAVPVFSFKYFKKQALIVELLSIALPLIVVGNMLQAEGYFIGRYVNIGAMIVLPVFTMYSYSKEGVFVDASEDFFVEK